MSLVLAALALASGAAPMPAHAASARVETGRIANGDYGERRQAVDEQVRPKEGYQTRLVLGDIVPRMVAHGIVDMEKMEALYKERGGMPPELKQVLTEASTTPLTVTRENADWLVNILWPIGLSNKMAINKRSPIAGKDLPNLASTGGWGLGKEKNGASYFNHHELIPLTAEQGRRVWRIATSTYRPCCDNSTFFQDCNHGSAALAVIELGVAQGLSDGEIYRTLLAFNAYWFGPTYVETALYFNVLRGMDWSAVDPRRVLSRRYSTASGWHRNVHVHTSKVAGLLPKPEEGGESCGI
ncbi:MAG: hypothetical protein F9K29_11695 [Hyphomicrobiaceae bacterium]|nr:MAG: hypothetical protein F9K29_11695 [Hyphomicrobiaceae bacterium]